MAEELDYIEEEQKNRNLPSVVDEIGEDKILAQVQKEYGVCYNFMRPKITEWLLRLTVYNNQKRDKKKIGDPLLFTVFQTLLASLYTDQLNVKFLPREQGDIETAENLNALAEYDHDKMKKRIIDFEWDWDTLFFGNSPLLIQEFNRKEMCPFPQVMDPCTLLRDPRAVAMNGDARGNNAARFWGREIALTGWELKNNKTYFNIKELKVGRELKSLLAKAKQKRRAAQGLSELPTGKEDDIGENSQYDILEWYTHIKGKKYLLGLGNGKTTLVRMTALKGKEWPVINRKLFPTAHDWDGVSVPDLVEDKQRARAVLQNIGLDSAKADVNPMYLFAEDRIKNRADLNFGFNKFVRVKGDSTQGAIEPMNKPVVHQQVSWIMDLLDTSSQRALATPEIQQGVQPEKARTLGELELVSSKVDTRYSLAAKVFGWSEKEFWARWYQLYKTHFKDKIDEKIIRLTGVWGPEFRPLKKKDIIGGTDPDVDIESKNISETERMIKRNAFVNFFGLVINDPEVNRRYAERHLAELNGFKRDEIKVLFPPILDEMEAEKENEMIENKERPRVEIRQDHQVHLMIHAKLNDSRIRDDHIEAHKFAMYQKKLNEILFQPTEEQPQMGQPKITPETPSKKQPATVGAGAKSMVIPESYGSK